MTMYARADDEVPFFRSSWDLGDYATTLIDEDWACSSTEIEAVLDFAQMVLLNASNLWKAAPSEQKQRLQQVLFPEGVTYSEGNYRTGVTCLLFSGMETKGVKKERLVVALTIASWNQVVSTLREIDILRREGIFHAA